MITIYTQQIKSFSQLLYDTRLSLLPFHQLSCPHCPHSGGFTAHASYVRFIKTNEAKVPIRIQRVKCAYCETTHALLPSAFVPYSQLLFHDHLQVIQATTPSQRVSLMERHLFLDESNIAYVLKQYRTHGLPRLLSYDISLEESLISHSFQYFHRMFMQIKSTVNLLFFPVHIT